MADQGLLRRRRPPHHPRACAPNVDPALSLARQVPVRPARFPVGPDEPGKPLFPPPEKVEGTALSVAAYLGRVEEVSEDGQVTVTVWERPNGREGMTSLSVNDHLGGRTPATGDLLWIWTWLDAIAETHAPKEQIHVEVETRALDTSDRARLHVMLAELTEDRG